MHTRFASSCSGVSRLRSSDLPDGIADHARRAAGEGNRMVALLLKAAEREQRHEVADVERIGGGIEAAVERDRPWPPGARSARPRRSQSAKRPRQRRSSRIVTGVIVPNPGPSSVVRSVLFGRRTARSACLARFALRSSLGTLASTGGAIPPSMGPASRSRRATAFADRDARRAIRTVQCIVGSASSTQTFSTHCAPRPEARSALRINIEPLRLDSSCRALR